MLAIVLILFWFLCVTSAKPTSTVEIPTYTFRPYIPTNTNECNVLYSHDLPNYIHLRPIGTDYSFSDNGNGYIYPDVYLKSANGSSVQLQLGNKSAIEYLMNGGQRIYINNDGISIFNASCNKAIRLDIPNLYNKARQYQKTVGNGEVQRDSVQRFSESQSEASSNVHIRDFQYLPINIKVLDDCGNWVTALPSNVCGGQSPIPACFFPFINDVGTGTYYRVLPWQDIKTLNDSCKSTLNQNLGFFTDNPLNKVADFGVAASFMGKILADASLENVGKLLLATLELPLAAAALGVIAVTSITITALGGKDDITNGFCAAQYANYQYEVKALLGTRTRTVTQFSTLPTATIRTTYTTKATTACPPTPTPRYPTINFFEDGMFEDSQSSNELINGYYANSFPYQGNQYISMKSGYYVGRTSVVYPQQIPQAGTGYRAGRPMLISFAYRMSSVDNYANCLFNYTVLASTFAMPLSSVMDDWVPTTVTVNLPSPTGSLALPRVSFSCAYPPNPTPTPVGYNVVDIDKFEIYGLDELYP